MHCNFRSCLSDSHNVIAVKPIMMDVYYLLGLIILNAWYGTFVSDTSQKQEKAKVIDVTVPLQCLVKDSKLILTEASKVRQTKRKFLSASDVHLNAFLLNCFSVCSQGCPVSTTLV